MKKTLAKVIFVIILILIVIYTFHDSAGTIMQQIAQTSLWLIIAVCLVSVIYHLFEGGILFLLSRVHSKDIHYGHCVACAFYAAFYRVATLGGGAGVAAVYYLDKKGLEYSKGTGVYTMMYVFHRISIMLFTTVFFLISWKFMAEHYSTYKGYLIVGYVLTFGICLGITLLGCWPKAHSIVVGLAKKINKSGKFDAQIALLEENVVVLEESFMDMIKRKSLILKMIVLNFLKLACWYSIPYILMYQFTDLTIVQSWAITALSVMIAAVIPAPAGVASTEFVYTMLYGVVVGVSYAGSSVLLYRFATFIVPFLIGIVFVILHRRDKGESGFKQFKIINEEESRQ
ncbi:lysylphosphatidylglycerol synthase transmembrane domain-containing protein [Eubacterium oxidoreducens]|uniref:Phosphatidylglycerol lysyltransferase n=1 Tax=Eubacterium oxidoreducens TaxID=1732 RepID=A0A1G5ZZR6_EUBOX|nr:lysylphosphatidylglycerol synthase transmembrane domain-containing protein [Eubacterium oxidoreducens]SDB01694.1 hypothetical protein SAMN02910417_00043 [Eubacterium oxidoreducens]